MVVQLNYYKHAFFFFINKRFYIFKIKKILKKMSLCDCNSLRSLQKEALQITVKVCQACRKEFAYCFCNNLCKEITSSKGHYYLTCANDQCMQIAIRCQY